MLYWAHGVPVDYDETDAPYLLSATGWTVTLVLHAKQIRGQLIEVKARAQKPPEKMVVKGQHPKRDHHAAHPGASELPQQGQGRETYCRAHHLGANIRGFLGKGAQRRDSGGAADSNSEEKRVCA